MVDHTWRKSTKCDNNACVELALVDGKIGMRDSAAKVLHVSAQAWVEFVEAVKDGEFDRP